MASNERASIQRYVRIEAETGDRLDGLLRLRGELHELANKTQAILLLEHIARAHGICQGLIRKEGGR